MNITFLLILGLWLSFTFFFKNVFNVNSRGERKYSWCTLLITLFCMSSILFRTVFPTFFPHYFFLELPFYSCLPVLIFCLNRGSSKKPYRLKGYRYLHLLPSLLSFLLMLPLYALDGMPKLEMGLAPPAIVLFLKWMVIFQVAGYLLLQFRGSGLFQNRVDRSDVKWRLTLGLSLFFLLFTAGQIVQAYQPLMEGLALIVLFVSVYSYLKTFSVVKHSPLQSDELGIAEMIEKVMLEEKIYLRDDLSLVKLAEVLELSTHKVSRALNSVMATGYNDYVNKYRVEEVVRLLSDRAHERYTLEAISRMAGFRSLTTFNAAFKKQTGLTPKQYKV